MIRALLIAGLAVVTVISYAEAPETQTVQEVRAQQKELKKQEKRARKELRAACRNGAYQHDPRCAKPRPKIQVDCVPIYKDGLLVECIDRNRLWREMQIASPRPYPVTINR